MEKDIFVVHLDLNTVLAAKGPRWLILGVWYLSADNCVIFGGSPKTSSIYLALVLFFLSSGAPNWLIELPTTTNRQ